MSTFKNPFILTPLESLLINKLMPKGFKLEAEENLNLSSPLAPKLNKEHKIKESIQSKCDNLLKKILSQDFSKEFYTRNNLLEPSIIEIEKEIKNNKFNTISDFINEIRNLNKFYLENYKNENEIINKITKLNEYTEKLFKNVDNSNSTNGNVERALKVVNDTPMSMEEKKMLGVNIKVLNQEQLKGIVKIILNNTQMNKKEKYLEFDIDKLTARKCRELEAYVRGCLGDKYSEVNNKNVNDIFSSKENEEISKDKDFNLQPKIL